MSWAKLDDRFHENRKIKRVWRRCPAAVGLHVMAITYCAGHETDGRVDVEFVEEKVPKKRERDRAVTELVAAGLWHESKDPKDGWEINDFLVFNPSREEAAETRKSKREAGRKGAAARWGDAGDKASVKADVIAGAIAGANGTAMADDAPSRPVPSPTTENTLVAEDGDVGEGRVERLASADVVAVFDAWVESTGRDKARTKLDAKRRRVILNGLKTYDRDELIDAVRGWRHSAHHRGENDRHTIFNDIELLLRDSKQIEKFRDLERGATPAPVNAAEDIGARVARLNARVEL